MTLTEYRAKRDFRNTPEPRPAPGRPRRQPIFVVQEHHARRLHYDFRLEVDGVLKSWAVPKEPSLDPAIKRLAVRVEDHPLAYASFEGTIPQGQYGAGTVRVWDRGTYENLWARKDPPRDMDQAIDAGHVEILLHGRRLRGRFALVRLDRRGGKENWLLIKMRDEYAVRKDGQAARRSGSSTRRRPGALALATTPDGDSSEETVEVTHPDKVLFPEEGITKQDVFVFYKRVAPRLLPYLRDRPMTLERAPDGIGGAKPVFWQKNTPAYYPDWIPRYEEHNEAGKLVRYALVNDAATLLYLVNQGTVTFHPWLSRQPHLDQPDFVLFDLDPGSGSFADLVEISRALREELQGQSQQAFVKTSGKRGLHVLVPWRDRGGYDKARSWALDVAEKVVERLPGVATVERSKARRGGRAYIDVMQNARGHHVVPPYVVRAVPAAMVSTPLDWHEVTPRLDLGRFTLKTIFRRLSRQKVDPWAPLLEHLQAGG